MQMPALSGVYVVELLNEQPISVNADRPSRAERCIRVTRENCKYGRAVNLARRQQDYFKTFGSANVRFHYFAVTEHYVAVEAVVGARLAPYRLFGLTGRPNEWLAGISAEEVEAIVRLAVESLETRPEAIPKAASRTVSRASTPLPRLGSTTAITPSRAIEAATYLRNHGMSVELLRDLHHSPRRDETFGRMVAYFTRTASLRKENVLYGSRLVWIAEEHRRTNRPLSDLVMEALQRPPSRLVEYAHLRTLG